MSIISDMAKKLSLHSDQVRASLRAVPTEIALDLTREQLEALVVSITNHSKMVFEEGRKIGEKGARLNAGASPQVIAECDCATPGECSRTGCRHA